MLSPKIFTNLHIIMYILILDFQLVVGGGEGNVYLHIGQIMQGSLSLTRGCGCGSLTRGCGCGRTKIASVLVVKMCIGGSALSLLIGGSALSLLIGGSARSLRIGGSAPSLRIGGSAPSLLIGGSALSLLIVRDNVTTHPSLRLYKPQSCFLKTDPIIIARWLKAVLYNRSTSPLVSVYNVFVLQSNASIYPIHCIYSGCDSRKNTLQSFVTMDIHSYFGVASSSKSVSASVGCSEDDSQSSDVERLEPHPPKNIVQLNPRRYRPNESRTRNGKRISCGWNMTTIIKEHFVRSVESRSLSHLKKTGGAWITKPLRTGKRQWRK